MLNDFFRLNGHCRDIDDVSVLVGHFETSNDLRNVIFRPDTLELDSRNARHLFNGKAFTNVSLAKTVVRGIVFRNCAFEDCLFIGTQFVDCEFHQCTFKGCNPFKVGFTDTYINPSVFEGMLDPVRHWNIGIHLFQVLYENAVNAQQREFADSAEFNRYKWKRHVLVHEHPGLGKLSPEFFLGWTRNFLFYLFAGYGIRARFVAFWGIALVISCLAINWWYWDSLGIIGKDGIKEESSPINIVYYTLATPIGVGDLTPAAEVGRLVFLVEAFSGYVVISLFVTWFVKRVLR